MLHSAYYDHTAPRTSKKKKTGPYLNVVALADKAPGDEGVQAAAVENPVGFVHLGADRRSRQHRAKAPVRA